MRGYRVLWVPGHRPRRHRDPDGHRAGAREGGDRPARPRPREVHRARVGLEARGQGHDPVADPRGSAARSTGRRERFTLDPDLSRAVRHAFVQLYREGLIYRGRYVVNWCPRCGTAVSDLEVVHNETDGHALPDPLRRAGRPLGRRRRDDAARDDARRHGARDPPGGPAHREAARQDGVLPIVGRELPVIEDPILVDREFGTGHRQGHPGARRQRLRGRGSGTACPRSSSSVRTGR